MRPSRDLSLIDLDAGTKKTLVEPSSLYDVFGANWSLNGEWISYGKFDPNANGPTARLHVMAADGTDDHPVDSASGTVHDMGYAWSNDSTRMIVGRGNAPDFSDDRTAVVPIDGTDTGVESRARRSVGRAAMAGRGRRTTRRCSASSVRTDLLPITSWPIRPRVR